MLTPPEGQYSVCTTETSVYGAGHYSICRIPQKQFWIIDFLSWYSVVFHVFPWDASFSNTVNTMEENEDS